MSQAFSTSVAPEQSHAVPTVADAMLTIAAVSDTATTVGDIFAMFDDDHVHAAVIVADGVLITVIERTDLESHSSDHGPAAHRGTLDGRVVAPDTPLEQARQRMLDAGRRRLAVIDADGTYRGLLCLKRTGTGFCSDQDVRARSAEAAHLQADCGRAARTC
jgi:CBS domain-containing protein